MIVKEADALDEMIKDYLVQGIRAYSTGDVVDAVRAWQEVLEKDPENLRAQTYMTHARAAYPKDYETAIAGVNAFDTVVDDESYQSGAYASVHKSRSLSLPQAMTEEQGNSNLTQKTRGVVASASNSSAGLPSTNSWPTSSGRGAFQSDRLKHAVDSSQATDTVVAKSKEEGRRWSEVQETAEDKKEEPDKQQRITVLMRRLREHLYVDDSTGAMEAAQKILDLDPVHTDAQLALERATSILISMYKTDIGDLTQVPKVKMRDDEIIWLDLDERSAFVLSLIDGQTQFSEVVAIAGFEEVQTYKILSKLVRANVVG